MQNESAARRWLPIFATGVLLGITSWQLVDSSLPPRIMFVEIEFVIVAAVMLEITIRLRRASRVSLAVVTLVQGLTSVGLCTLILGLSASRLSHPVPAHRPRIRRSAAHRRSGWTSTCAHHDPAGSQRGNDRGLVVGRLVRDVRLQGARSRSARSWSAWSCSHMRTGHSQIAAMSARRRRLRAVADVARRLGLTTNSRGVAAAVLTGCHETYPEATWGRHPPVRYNAGGLTTLPLILGPDGVSPAAVPATMMAPGDGVIGRVYTRGEPCLLRTPREIRHAYASMPDSRISRAREAWQREAFEKCPRRAAVRRWWTRHRRARAHLALAPRRMERRRPDRRAGDRRRSRRCCGASRSLRGEGAACHHRPADEGRQPACVRGASRRADAERLR